MEVSYVQKHRSSATKMKIQRMKRCSGCFKNLAPGGYGSGTWQKLTPKLLLLVGRKGSPLSLNMLFAATETKWE